MTKTSMVLTCAIACALAGAGSARAQGREPLKTGFVNVDIGAQPQRRSLEASNTFTIYDEPATVTAIQGIRNGGLFEVSGGYKVASGLAVGAGVSRFGRAGSGTVTASIPHPAFFGRPATKSVITQDLAHREIGLHMRVTWFKALSDKLDLALSGGPSIIRVTQDVGATVTVQTGTQNFTVAKASESGSGFGVNAGLDVNYLLAPAYGIGFFGRYATASVDLATAPGFRVGGFQTGVGFRARF